ncbi:MAG: sensor histidine kinase [Elainellaceae cyanobacterium]
MAWINLVFLAAIFGIGLIAWRSRIRNQAKESLQDGPSEGTPEPSSDLSSSDSSSSESSDLSSHALYEELLHTQLAYQMAIEMGHFKAGFLARTSHELRSPMNGVLSLHQLILADLCEDHAEEREFVAQAYACGQKMLALLDETINISKLEHGTTRLNIQPLQLSYLLSEVRQLTQLHAQNRNVKLHIDEPDSDLYVAVDHRWFRQVLINLIVTPIYAMDGGSVRVVIESAPPSNTVVLRIEDDRPQETWSEPLDLMQQSPEQLSSPKACLQALRQANDTSKLATLAPLSTSGLSLVSNQIIMHLMQGSLEILAAPSKNGHMPNLDHANTIQIQCEILLAQPEA